MEDFDKFLANYYSTHIGIISDIYKNKLALQFLMVWSTFEISISNGFFQKNMISGYASNIHKNTILKLEDEFIHFHDRYQNKKNYNGLKCSDNYNRVNSILDKNIVECSNSDKIVLLLYVIYRYRNNLFHGNKRLSNWLNYNVQITHCIQIMIKILEGIHELHE